MCKSFPDFLVVDADSIGYLISDSALNADDMIELTNRKVSELVQDNKFVLVLSSDTNFRKAYPEYKSGRLRGTVPKYKDLIRNYLREKYNSIVIEGLEADDTIRIIDGIFTKQKVVKVSLDKDILNLPGYSRNFKDTEITYKTQIEYELFFLRQLITGDTADSIKGIPQKGDAFFNNKFEKHLENINNIVIFAKDSQDEYEAFLKCSPILDEMHKMVWEFYQERQLEDSYYRNYRLLKIMNLDEFIRNFGVQTAKWLKRKVKNSL